jgi:hypothetical protein
VGTETRRAHSRVASAHVIGCLVGDVLGLESNRVAGRVASISSCARDGAHSWLVHQVVAV